MRIGLRDVADARRHGATEEAPAERFAREEAAALRPICGRPRFQQLRQLVRRVSSDCTIELDANSYSVPWRLVGAQVQVVVGDGRGQIRHAGAEIAMHAELAGRRQRSIDPAHFHGVAGRHGRPMRPSRSPFRRCCARCRPMSRAVGGAWS